MSGRRSQFVWTFIHDSEPASVDLKDLFLSDYQNMDWSFEGLENMKGQ